MDNANRPPEAAPQPRLVTSVTAEELDQMDIEGPISDSKSFDPHDLSALYGAAATASENAGKPVEALVYGLFQSLLGMHFKPSDRAEPYGPLFVFRESRSMMMSDIPAELTAGLAAAASSIKHPVLRARIADISWTANRKLGNSATIAIDSYCDCLGNL